MFRRLPSAAAAFSSGLHASEQNNSFIMLLQLSRVERSKLEEATLVNVSGRTKNRSGLTGRWTAQPGQKERIVVTILLAADTTLKLPTIRSQEELRAALASLGSLRTEQV